MKSPMLWFLAVCFLPVDLIPGTVLCRALDIWCVSYGDGGAGTGTVIQGPDDTVVLFGEGGGAVGATACKNVPSPGVVL